MHLYSIVGFKLLGLFFKGGTAAKLAWPRLNDYFTRFRLSTRFHVELDVFAPTLSKLPIYIRPTYRGNAAAASTMGNGRFEGSSPAEAIEETSTQQLELRQQMNDNYDQWADLFDDNNEEKEDVNNDIEEHTKQKTSVSPTIINSKSSVMGRYAFFNAAKSFWSGEEIVYKNVGRSVRNICLTNQNKKSRLYKWLK